MKKSFKGIYKPTNPKKYVGILAWELIKKFVWSLHGLYGEEMSLHGLYGV